MSDLIGAPISSPIPFGREVDTETRISLTLRQLANDLPRFSDGRIDYTQARIALVLNCVVCHQGDVLLLKRSDKVGTYRGKWSAVAGFIDRPQPLEDIVLLELREELGVDTEDIAAIRIAEPYELCDTADSKIWLIYPVMAELKRRPIIRLDWEHADYCWIKPSDIGSLETIPGQDESLQRALRAS